MALELNRGVSIFIVTLASVTKLKRSRNIVLPFYKLGEAKTSETHSSCSLWGGSKRQLGTLGVGF